MDAIANLSGYQITEQLYAGTRTLVYRGIRTNDRHPVVIKILRNKYPNFNELVGFRNQYAIAKNLDFPSIIKPLSLEAYHNSYALVMEDFGGISLSTYLRAGTDKNQSSNSLDLTEFLNKALLLSEILDYLYQNRIIHKDIKPANILINPETQQIQLIDFSISSLLPRETQEIQNANALEGTLAYLSPEQTGRMNRGIDYRSDFYSLGITFYELLTGELPFVSDDPMELVHCHLAKQPMPIEIIQPEIPLVISQIVSKLMAKNAEDRYQSALGLKHDLEICLLQLRETGKIEYFELGKRDICDRFTIPEKLYGRESEVQTLLDAFERVSNGNTEMMLVAGFSGIGKTAVVNEVHKPIVRQRGYFIKGKFDQFNRNIPLSAFVQAFRDLMGQLLSESDEQLQSWKNQILAAVGENGKVLIDVIPELELIIGEQPTATELSGTAAQNRFNLLFQKFLQIFTSKEHPLVMFLDDLQWADSASLGLLKLLLQDTGYLLVLGAYRDNEVSAAHPCILTVNEIVKTGATLNTISLQPLRESDLNRLVADTLNCELSIAKPLTKLAYQKTKGNPFFATQFLKALHNNKLISFNWDIQHWQCDITKVKALAITDDVVEFMALQLQKLPLETRNTLKLAACIGAQFDLNTLAIVSEQSALMISMVLWQALQEGLIIPLTQSYKFFAESDNKEFLFGSANPSYRFLHDRVQQAAYSLIPEEQKQSTHLKIGQLLLENSSAAEQEENIFAIVNQLNIGRSLIAQPSDKDQLVQLNLTAAIKSKKSTAYGASIQYLETSIELLPEDSWKSQFDLTRTIYEEAAEAAYLSTNYQQMEQLVAIALSHIDSLIDKIRIYEIKMLGARVQDRLLESVQIGLQLLQLLGIEFPEEPTPADIGQASEQTMQLWKDRSIASLLDAPAVTDPVKLAVMRILNQMVPSAYPVAPMLVPLLISKQIDLSIADGNCEISAISYAEYGLMLCGFMGDLDAGYQFGQLALNILDRFPSTTGKCRAYFIIYSLISHWKESLHSGLSFLREGYQVGLEIGDSESSALNAYIYCIHAYFAGNELSNLAAEMEVYHQGISQLKQEQLLSGQVLYQQIVLNLLGESDRPTNLNGSVYDESQAILMLEKSNNLNQLYHLYHTKTVLCYLFGEYQQAGEYIILAESCVQGVAGTFAVPLFSFYSSLLSLALFASLPETEQAQTLEKVATHQEKLQHWAHHAPMNHLHKWYLVEAEKYRVLGDKAEAIELYDRAISLAKENEYLQDEALANELAANFYLDWGKEKVASGYMQEAYYCYARWGAKAKAIDLEIRYPQLLQPILQQPKTTFDPLSTLTSITNSSTPGFSNSISDTLDFASVIKAAQALSSTIKLDELLQQLTQIILQNSGADKCILVLPQDKTWQVRAISTPETTELYCEPLDNNPNVPLKLIQYVKRTQSVVVIDNLATNLPVIGDYLIQRQPKSVLCLPILDRRNLRGILYLKNRSTAGVFTNSRIQILNFLCTQAAISLENATLYNTLEQKVIDRTQELSQTLEYLQSTQKKLVESEKMAALGSLVAGVAHEINTPLGTSVTAASLLAVKTQDFVNAIATGSIKRSILSEYADIAQETSQLILTNLQRAGNLVQSFKQVAVDRSNLECRTFLLKDYFEDILFTLQPKLKQTPHNITISGDEDLQITSYPGALSQIITNFITNSIAHAYPSGTAGQLQLNISQQDEQIVITYQDDGCGIPVEHLDKIFDPFFTTARNRGGTGLGLNIVYNLVTQKLSGQIDVQSESDRGTMFTLVLPQVVPTQENA